MPEGYGFGGLGFVEPWGSVNWPGPPEDRELGPFAFHVQAMPCAFELRTRLQAPTALQAPDWNRHLKVLRKKGEWPQAHDDPGAEVRLDAIFPTPTPISFIDSGLEEGETYYYALFTERFDSVWVHDRFTMRDSAFPYGMWGSTEYMWQSLPRGWRSQDAGIGDAEGFVGIFGCLVDGAKTEIEHIRTLVEIEAIHDDLIWMLDAKIAWPTWHATGGLQRRRETSTAVDVMKLLGRSVAYEQLLSEASTWDVDVYQGWKHVMFSNGLYGSTTPDFTDPDLLDGQGTPSTKLKYTNSSTEWLSVSGLGFFLTEIPGVSGPFTSSILERCLFLIEWAKATYVNTQLFLVPITDESTPLSLIIDEWFESSTYFEGPPLPMSETFTTTDDIALFMSLDPGSVTLDPGSRTFHEDLEYV